MDVERDLREHIEAAMEAASKEESERSSRKTSGSSRRTPNGGASTNGTNGSSSSRKMLPTNSSSTSLRTPPPSASSGFHKKPSESSSGSAPARSTPPGGLSSSRLPASSKLATPPSSPSGSRPRPPNETMGSGATWPAGSTSQTGSFKAQKAVGPKRTDAPSGRPARLELIEYGPDEQLIDHKGRSKPMYKPRSPRPDTWRPGRAVRMLLGLFPGVRVMALSSARDGAPYAALGLLSLVAGLFLMVGLPSTSSTIDTLLIDPRWTLVHAAAVVVLFVVYETLRLASCFEERTSALRAPRILAALFIPSLITLVFGPLLMPIWPRLVEAAWFSALVLALGATAGMIWTAFEGTLDDDRMRRTFRTAGLTALVALVIVAIASESFSGAALKMLASLARLQGFRALPAVLDFFV